jgi:hypothetical protein
MLHFTLPADDDERGMSQGNIASRKLFFSITNSRMGVHRKKNKKVDEV